MNKWKGAFSICFTTLILVLALGLNSIIDQGLACLSVFHLDLQINAVSDCNHMVTI